MAHIWTSLMPLIEMLRQAITDLFCFRAKSRGVCLFVFKTCSELNSNFQRTYKVLCLSVFL